MSGDGGLGGDAARDALLDLRDILFECAHTDRATIARAVAEVGRAHVPDAGAPDGFGAAYADLVRAAVPGTADDLAARIDALGIETARERLGDAIEALMAGAAPGRR